MSTSNKKAIIIGKGPSAKKVGNLHDTTIFALNSAFRLCDRIDYLVMNDVETFEQVSEEDWEKINGIIIPVYPNKNEKKSRDTHYSELLQRVPRKIECIAHNLHNETDLQEYPYLGTPWSVAITAIQWLSKNGYKECSFCGIDSVDEYHEEFSKLQKVPNARNWYEINYQYFLRTAMSNGIKLTKYE